MSHQFLYVTCVSVIMVRIIKIGLDVFTVNTKTKVCMFNMIAFVHDDMQKMNQVVSLKVRN